jgi:hypothetical protein
MRKEVIVANRGTMVTFAFRRAEESSGQLQDGRCLGPDSKRAPHEHGLEALSSDLSGRTT